MAICKCKGCHSGSLSLNGNVKTKNCHSGVRYAAAASLSLSLSSLFPCLSEFRPAHLWRGVVRSLGWVAGRTIPDTATPSRGYLVYFHRPTVKQHVVGTAHRAYCSEKCLHCVEFYTAGCCGGTIYHHEENDKTWYVIAK